MATLQLRGETLRTNGELPATGGAAPDALLVDLDLRDVRLHDFLGQTLIVSAVPSLDTPTCALSSRRLDQVAHTAGAARVLVISADTPFAQGRFLQRENLSRVQTLSMLRDRSFAERYGLLIIDGPLAGLCARALLVIDAQGTIRHAQLVAEVTQEPDYDRALSLLPALSA